jgi:hypothetical protein
MAEDLLSQAVRPTHLGVGRYALPTNAVNLTPSGDYKAVDPVPVLIPTLGASGLIIFVHMTAATGAGNTVTVNIDVFDPVSGAFITIGTAALTSAVADFIVVVDPRVTADPTVPAGSKHVQIPLPDQLRIRAIGSGTRTTLNYSVGAALCL